MDRKGGSFTQVRRLEIQATMHNPNSTEVSPSGQTFLARFVQEQRARGRSSGPLDGLFAHLADAPTPPPSQPAAATTALSLRTERATARLQGQKKSHAGPLFEHLGSLISTRAPAGSWPLGHLETPPPAPVPRFTPSAADGPMKTVHDFTAERAIRRVQLAEPPAPLVLFHPVESLTACMNSADCPETARHIFRVLFSLGLESVRARGVPVRPDVAVYHLPLELLAAHIERDRTTVWRNLRPLIASGVLAAVDHFGTLRGQTAVTGKVWAVSLCPERVLSGHAAPVKVTMGDLRYPWRDLDRDTRQGRTVYALTRSEERQQAEKAQREAKREERAAAKVRAEDRLTTRAQARAAGEVVPRGRAAATANAAQTRAEKTCSVHVLSPVQQSVKDLKAVERGELERWVLAPFSSPTSDVTLTVAPAFSDGLDAVFSLPTLAGLSRSRRGELVEKIARTLAASFEDSENLKFWCWLIWQTLRAYDQGQDWTADVAHIMARVLHDLRQDEQMGNRAQNRPAALVVNGLRNCGLLEALRQIAPTRVGKRPRAA
ncbi:hypothetical protein BOO71_0003439 [Deinococcus marmoris]|uniref:Replication protein n=2 Tax=Deinococcus marmoris TaxID=249408 RepID=A0A1U7P231_9DEIO|nr:hypothetical protein BOO71_0003439 [Deinococcus marmoris]